MTSVPSKGSTERVAEKRFIPPIRFSILLCIFLFSLHPPFFVPPPLILHYRLVNNSVVGGEVKLMLMAGDAGMEVKMESSRDLPVSIVLKQM